MQKIIVIIFFAIVIITVILFSKKNHAIPKDKTKISTLAKRLNSSKRAPVKYTAIEEKKPMKKISTSNNMAADEIELSTSHTHIFYETLSFDEAILTTKPRKNIQPIEAISLRDTDIESVKVHDKLTLPNIEGDDYTIIISAIIKNSDGSSSLTGVFKDEGISYTTTMTKSTHSSYVTLSTPQGTYEIETRDGVGYIYKTSDIRKHLQKPNVNDVIVLPIPKSTTHQ